MVVIISSRILQNMEREITQKYCSSHRFHAHTPTVVFSLAPVCQINGDHLSSSLSSLSLSLSSVFLSFSQCLIHTRIPAGALCSLRRCAANLKDITHRHTPGAVCRWQRSEFKAPAALTLTRYPLLTKASVHNLQRRTLVVIKDEQR